MYGIYYNEYFDSIMISIDDKNTVASVKLPEKNIELIKPDKDGVSAINVFDVHKDIHIRESFCSFNQKVLDYLKKRLDGVFDFKQDTQFVIGHVLECEPIEGTHLHKTVVDVKNEKLQIVCGAKNIAKDQYVVVALPGAWMPNGQHIVPGQLRGIDSNGMICSAKELALVNHDFNTTGIIELPETYKDKVGNDFFKEFNNYEEI